MSQLYHMYQIILLEQTLCQFLNLSLKTKLLTSSYSCMIFSLFRHADHKAKKEYVQLECTF